MTLLSLDQLSRFESALRAAGAPVVDALLPGLSSDEVQAAFAELDDVHLPDELLTWWSWHGGVDRNRDPQALLGSTHILRSPSEVATSYGELRDVRPAGWLAWTGSYNPTLYADASSPGRQAAEIYAQGKGEDPSHAASSVGEMVERWIGFLEAGVWWFDVNATNQGQVNEDLLVNPDLITYLSL